MKSIDSYSFMCGVIDCFNEMVGADLKQIALSHPSNNMDELIELIPYSNKACENYGTRFFIEEEVITTDLFPKSMTAGMKVIIYYKYDKALARYKALKKRKAQLLLSNEYHGEARYKLAHDFGKLLSYPDSGIDDHIAKNDDME